jgi:type VI secretion system protein ImpI
MSLVLQLVNETTLPDGGPVSVRVSGKRGIDIGRGSHLDWTLPDQTRFISSKHCEVRYRDGGYWLHDVSTNGTFLNGAEQRMRAPHQLRDGDRFTVGHYVVAVTIDGPGEAAGEDLGRSASPPPQLLNDQELWADVSDVAPAIDSKQLRPARENRPVNPDFLDWAADVPTPFDQPLGAAPPARATPSMAPSSAPPPELDWAAGAPSVTPVPLQPPPPAPAPRRPLPEAARSMDWDEADRVQPNPSAASRPADNIVARATHDRSFDDFPRDLIRAAGLPDDIAARTSPAELAQQIGTVLRLVTENLMQLLTARQQAKRFARSSSHTTVEAVDNNPLKFSPSASEALATMLGPKSAGYLDAQRAVLQAFGDLKAHQLRTYSAMQHALTMILGDLDPKKIERDNEAGGGIGGLLQSRNAKLWEAYKARWDAKIGRKGGDAVEAFMQYFAEHYDNDKG